MSAGGGWPNCHESRPDPFHAFTGEILKPRRFNPARRTMEYIAPKGVCAKCALRSQCTRASYGRTLQRHKDQQALDRARAQAHSTAARRNRRRRQHLMERSFADAANNHGFKRSRWRRLWRQQIQDHLIAAIQNVRILISRPGIKPAGVMSMCLSVQKGLTQPLPGSKALGSGMELGVLRLCRWYFANVLPRMFAMTNA